MNNSSIILYSDAKREYFPTEEQYSSEAEVEGRAYVIEKYLKRLGFKTFVLPTDDNFIELVKKIKPTIIFNLADSIHGQEYMCSAVPAALEIIGAQYTGTGQLGLALSSNKFLTNTLLEHAGVPVPKYQLFSSYKEKISKNLKFPVISKLNSIHGSIEINQSAISENEKTLRRRLKFLINTYKDEVLVSEYIEGEEVAAILLEGVHKKVYTGKKILDGKSAESKYKIMSFDTVWGDEDKRFHYEKHKLTKELRALVIKAYEVLRIDDYAKFDIRINKAGRYRFIDINPNNALGPLETECDISMILNLYGIRFEEILRRLILNNLNGHTPNFLLSKNINIKATPA